MSKTQIKTQIKSLKLRIRALEEELATCTTAAQDACVRASLNAAWLEMGELDGRNHTMGRYPRVQTTR